MGDAGRGHRRPAVARRREPGELGRSGADAQRRARQSDNTHASHTQASDTQAHDTHADDAQASHTQASDAQASDAQASHTQRRLILLRDAGGRARPDRNVAVEAAAMIAARAAGVPVAELYDYGEGALGQAYLLMERLDGETIRAGCCGTTRTPPRAPGSRTASGRSWPGSIRSIPIRSRACPTSTRSAS